MNGERTAEGRSFHDQPEYGWLRRRVIWSCDASKGPLLTRWHLVQTPWFGVYLHHLQASDEDRALHDHPWSFITFLLTGGYFEHHVAGEQNVHVRSWRRRFSILWRPAEWQHRLELTRPVWTLVFRMRRRRSWGFITARGWQHWRDYGKEWCD